MLATNAARAALGLLWLALLAAPVASRGDVEFVYADANEGGASGGHVALRVDERVYHFQRDAAGALAIARDSWSDFAFQYRVIENRTLTATRLAATSEEARRLRAHFDARVLTEAIERERLRALRDDVALLESWMAAGASGAVAMRGVGFFAPGAPAADARAQSAEERAARAALARVRERIASARGAGFLEARRRAARESLRDLEPEPASTASGERATGGQAAGEQASGERAAQLTDSPFSPRYADALLAERAVAALLEPTPLERTRLRAVAGSEGALASAERAALRERRDALETSLVRLAASQRPDWGFAFLLGAARLAALAESIESGRLLVLDALPADAPALRASAAHEALQSRLDWRRERLLEARRAYLEDPADRRAEAALEAATARHGALAGALRDGAPWRVAPGPLLPEGRAAVRALPRPAFARGDLTAILARAKERVAAAVRERERSAGYDLVRQNCVTELLREMALAHSGGEGWPARRPDDSLVFVPFLTERAVLERWPALERRVLLSHRRARAREHARDGGWLAVWRESTTLFSSTYAPHAGDSTFLFFTDDAHLARPLLGAANLATALAASAGGVLALPFDGGTTLLRGLRGAVASVPELFFANVRKGTFPLALPADARGAAIMAAHPARSP